MRNETGVLKLDCASQPEDKENIMECVQDVNLEFSRAPLESVMGKKIYNAIFINISLS